MSPECSRVGAEVEYNVGCSVPVEIRTSISSVAFMGRVLRGGHPSVAGWFPGTSSASHLRQIHAVTKGKRSMSLLLATLHAAQEHSWGLQCTILAQTRGGLRDIAVTVRTNDPGVRRAQRHPACSRAVMNAAHPGWQSPPRPELRNTRQRLELAARPAVAPMPDDKTTAVAQACTGPQSTWRTTRPLRETASNVHSPTHGDA